MSLTNDPYNTSGELLNNDYDDDDAEGDEGDARRRAMFSKELR